MSNITVKTQLTHISITLLLSPASTANSWVTTVTPAHILAVQGRSEGSNRDWFEIK